MPVNVIQYNIHKEEPKMNKPWDLESALLLVRALQPMTKGYGYHLTLGGSVLNTGRSNKDLDLYFLPFNNDKKMPKADPEGLVAYLTKLWGMPQAIGHAYEEDKPDVPAPGAFWGAQRVEPIIQQLYYLGGRDADMAWARNLRRPGPEPNAEQFYALPPQLLREPNPFEVAPIEAVGNAVTGIESGRDSIYRYKLKFQRNLEDRIDIFIV